MAHINYVILMIFKSNDIRRAHIKKRQKAASCGVMQSMASPWPWPDLSMLIFARRCVSEIFLMPVAQTSTVIPQMKIFERAGYWRAL